MRVLFHHGGTEWTGCVRVFADAARMLGASEDSVVFTCRPDTVVEQRVSALSDVELVTLEPDGSWLDESNRLRRVLREEFIEVVFVHTAREHLVAGGAMRAAGRGAVVRRVPEGAALAIGKTERAAALLATTGYLFTTHDERAGAKLPSGTLTPVVAPLGVDVEAYDTIRAAPRPSLGVPPGGRLLACVADVESRARLATVLRAFALLAERHPELRLVLIGPGSDHEDLRMHAAALGVTHVVGFLGDRDDQLAVLRTADLGWVVAEHDAAAYGFLDLMALGTAVVAERGPIAARYVADGITGVLLPPADAPGAAAAIATLLAQNQVRATMGTAARVRAARDFDAAAMADGFRAAAEAARDRTKWRVR
ncbi:MAG TPA: glycosyltransferase [Gemmatimonadaceae bacterium]|nr:glycosyltransferase [Gemmatimonadaceae bacterium]